MLLLFSAAFRKFVPKLGCAKNPEWDTDLTGLSIGDAGDAAGASLEEAHADLKKRVMGILSAGGIPFVVGGGNDQSYPNADALMSTCGSDVVSVINVDAHLVRTRAVCVSGNVPVVASAARQFRHH